MHTYIEQRDRVIYIHGQASRLHSFSISLHMEM